MYQEYFSHCNYAGIRLHIIVRYWIYWNDLVQGPFELDELISLKAFSEDLLVCLEDRQEWLPASRIADLAPSIERLRSRWMTPAMPPPPPPDRPPALTPLQGDFFGEAPGQTQLFDSGSDETSPGPKASFSFTPAEEVDRSSVLTLPLPVTNPIRFLYGGHSAAPSISVKPTMVTAVESPIVISLPVVEPPPAPIEPSIPPPQQPPQPRRSLFRAPPRRASAVPIEIEEFEPPVKPVELPGPIAPVIVSEESPFPPAWTTEPLLDEPTETSTQTRWLYWVAAAIALLAIGIFLIYWMIDRSSSRAAIAEVSRQRLLAPIAMPANVSPATSATIPTTNDSFLPTSPASIRRTDATGGSPSHPAAHGHPSKMPTRRDLGHPSSVLLRGHGGMSTSQATTKATQAAQTTHQQPKSLGHSTTQQQPNGSATSRAKAAARKKSSTAPTIPIPFDPMRSSMVQPNDLLPTESSSQANLAPHTAAPAQTTSPTHAPAASKSSPKTTEAGGVCSEDNGCDTSGSLPQNPRPGASAAGAPSKPAANGNGLSVPSVRPIPLTIPATAPGTPTPKNAAATPPAIAAPVAGAPATPIPVDIWQGRQNEAIDLVMHTKIIFGKSTVGTEAAAMLAQMHQKEILHAAATGERLYLPDKINWSATREEKSHYRVFLNFSGLQADGERAQAMAYQYQADLQDKSVGSDDQNTRHDFFAAPAPLVFKHDPLADDVELVLAAVDALNKHKLQAMIIQNNRHNQSEIEKINKGLVNAQQKVDRNVAYFRNKYPETTLQNIGKAYEFSGLIKPHG